LLVSVYTDITELKHRQQELEEAKDAAEAALSGLRAAQQQLVVQQKMAAARPADRRDRARDQESGDVSLCVPTHQEYDAGRAAEPVWALVSGLPRGEREKRLFMVLQAYIDDTGNSPNEYTFMLAGFVASSEAWAKFCDDWQALLDRPPGAVYLKTTHAYSLRFQFHKSNGWTRTLRDTFMIDAADIIRSHVRESVAVWARREYFDKHIGTLALPYARDAAEHPYFLCFYHLILSVAALHSLVKPEPCDFIFDEQSKLVS
jgi:hypothetical protein